MEVPGLAEKRPSVIVSDGILVRPHGETSSRWFRGIVHTVQLLQVGLKFHPSFHSIMGLKYDVQFELNRLTYRRMHQALDSPFREARVLFPTLIDISKNKLGKPTDIQMEEYTPFDRLVGQNPPQWLAATAVALLKPGSLPFVVFGP